MTESEKIFVTKMTTQVENKTEVKRKGIRLGAFIVAFFIPLLFARQIFVNISGGERHSVGTIVVIIAMLAIYTVLIIFLLKESKGIRIFNALTRPIFLLQILLVLYWIILVFISPGGGSLVQRMMSSSYAAEFTLMIWVPVIFFTSEKDVRRAVKILIIAAAIVGLIGILQWFVPETNLPVLLKGDRTVFMSGTMFGTTRVNGLIGTPLEFALLMAMMALLFYIRLMDRLSFSSLIMFTIMFLGLAFAASRTFWIVTVGAMLIITLLHRRKRLLSLLVPIVLIFTILIIPSVRNYFYEPMVTQHSGYVASGESKILSVKKALGELRSSPLIGTGLGFQTAPAFGDSSKKIIGDGFWWAILLEGGILGFLLVFGFLGLIGRTFLIALKNKNSQRSIFVQQLIEWGIVFVGIAVLGNFINSSLNNLSLNIAFYLMIGIVLATINIEFRKRSAQETITKT